MDGRVTASHRESCYSILNPKMLHHVPVGSNAHRNFSYALQGNTEENQQLQQEVLHFALAAGARRNKKEHGVRGQNGYPTKRTSNWKGTNNAEGERGRAQPMGVANGRLGAAVLCQELRAGSTREQSQKKCMLHIDYILLYCQHLTCVKTLAPRVRQTKARRRVLLLNTALTPSILPVQTLLELVRFLVSKNPNRRFHARSSPSSSITYGMQQSRSRSASHDLAAFRSGEGRGHVPATYLRQYREEATLKRCNNSYFARYRLPVSKVASASATFYEYGVHV